jgi:hypothetical protein
VECAPITFDHMAFLFLEWGGNKHVLHNVGAYTIRKTVCTAHEASLLAASINLQLQYIVQYVVIQPAARSHS